MKLEQATIALVPRTTPHCLDLAVRYFGSHLPGIAVLWLVVTVPACAVLVLLSRWFDINVLVAAGVFLLASSPLGVLLGLAVVPSAFGEPFTWDNLLPRLRRPGLRLLAKGLGLRLVIGLGLLLCVFPGVWLALETGFFVERACLADLDRRLSDRRSERLLRDALGDLLIRACGIVLFCTAAWLLLFLTVDALSDLLFAFPILLGRIAPAGGLFAAGEYGTYLLFQDPRTLAAAVATALAVYPIGRIAWFLCYVDVRVRRDLWDVQLRFTEEAQRLEAGR